MEQILTCNKEEKHIIALALYKCLDHYKKKLNETDDYLYTEVAQDKIKIIKNLLKELEA